MSLPKIDKPIYEVYLKSLDKKIRFRPFTVKEEKLLLMAGESSDEKELTAAIKQITNNCALDPVDTDTLPIFDLEMFFIHLRARSVGEVAVIRLICDNTITTDDGAVLKCGFITDVDYNVLEAQYKIQDKHTNLIKLNETVAIKMKYPDLDMIKKLNYENESDDDFLKFIILNIDSIIDGEEIIDPQSVPQEELLEFIENLSRYQVYQISEFFTTTPKVVGNIKYTCAKCGYNHDIELEGIQNFFE